MSDRFLIAKNTWISFFWKFAAWTCWPCIYPLVRRNFRGISSFWNSVTLGFRYHHGLISKKYEVEREKRIGDFLLLIAITFSLPWQIVPGAGLEIKLPIFYLHPTDTVSMSFSANSCLFPGFHQFSYINYFF